MIKSNDGRAALTLRLNEKQFVENPLLEQLEGLGYAVWRLEQTSPASASGRSSVAEVTIKGELEAALKAINPFLEPDQLEEVSRKIVDLPQGSLLENNRAVFDLLMGGATVAENRLTGEALPTVRFVDFEDVSKNRFLAVCQFKVNLPGSDHHIVPDVVIFVNGLPLVVLECKSPKVRDAIGEALDQLLRYSAQRGESGEGNARLFWYNAFWVATCRNVAKFGTLTTHIEKHLYRWMDPYPLTLDDLAHGGQTTPNDQQRLVAGMCRQENLLSLLRSYTAFAPNASGQTEKIVGRYQQFRAVKKALERLRSGTSPRERSGIIWHTQGSGKSLTMLFMVREMRQLREFAAWKIVFITDRTDLERQLSGVAVGIGQTLKVASSIKDLKALLKNPAPDLVMGMIHKFQDAELSETFEQLNLSEQVLTLTDEAHRSQYGLLGANLDRALPHAARIGYTGTPIEKTEKTFGEYIDKYTMRESIEDGTTLEIVYEGRTHNAEVPDKSGADAAFEDVFSDYSLLERLQILGYGSRDAYLESEATIGAKARDMVAHYLGAVFPNGFKGQVVANSREAAARYKTHLDAALLETRARLALDNPQNLDLTRLEKLETAVVISAADRNERPHLKVYGDREAHKRAIARFKLPFGVVQGDGPARLDGNVALIVVNNMLLTGFDAPLEQVLYLDQPMRDHNLLQTIARVNRVSDAKKEVGFVVDYVGIGHHLKRALDAYAEKEQAEILPYLSDPQTEVAALEQAYLELWALLKAHGISDFSDPDAFYDLFYDEDVRFAYLLAFKKLSSAFNVVLPRKEALEHFGDYLNFVALNEQAAQHLHDTRLSMRGIPDKLRALADLHLASQGIEVRVRPISILDEAFGEGVAAKSRSRTKAAEVEHAIRHYLTVNEAEDPELFASFAEQLEELMQRFKDNWDAIYRELEALRGRIRAKEQQETHGLSRKREMPIFRILEGELYPDSGFEPNALETLVRLTRDLMASLEREVAARGFWQSIPAQNRLKAELQDLLLSPDFVDLPGMFSKRAGLLNRVLEWARENHATVVGP